MRKEIGYLVMSGWAECSKKIPFGCYYRSFHVLPMLKVSIPWGVGHCLLYAEFGLAYWSGQFSVRTIRSMEKSEWT